MQISISKQFGMVLTIAVSAATVMIGSVRAQEWNSPLMEGLEQPFSAPVATSIVGEDVATSADMHLNRNVQQTVYSVRDQSLNPQITKTCCLTNSSATGECTESEVCSEDCMEKKPWWKRLSNKWNRKAYFNYHSCHAHALHPIVHPACQPGYGYYETCWRKISPNPCFCPTGIPQQNGVLMQQPTYGSPHLVPAESSEPLPPAPAYDQ